MVIKTGNNYNEGFRDGIKMGKETERECILKGFRKTFSKIRKDRLDLVLMNPSIFLSDKSVTELIDDFEKDIEKQIKEAKQ